MERATFVTNFKGNTQVVDKAGQVYQKHYTKNEINTTYWRCREHKKSCNGRVITQGIYVKTFGGFHNHFPPDMKH